MSHKKEVLDELVPSAVRTARQGSPLAGLATRGELFLSPVSSFLVPFLLGSGHPCLRWWPQGVRASHGESRAAEWPGEWQSE